MRVLVDEISALVARLSCDIAPALTHRDLYLDNLLASPEGDLRAILDSDLAEVWDPVVDFVKLRWQVFSRYPGAKAAFCRGYEAETEPLPMLRERLHVVDLLELINAVSNAGLQGWEEFEEQNRTHLRDARANFAA
jgi:aminoglycoside phosphotransferase (APT) family kinase protein